jgi:hypothetical protein
MKVLEPKKVHAAKSRNPGIIVLLVLTCEVR